MDRGYSVLIFPEGTRSRDGRLHAFRPGIGLLAAQSRVPIVPIALVGLDEIRATHARWFRSGKIEVRIGQAIAATSEESDPAEFTARLEEVVRTPARRAVNPHPKIEMWAPGTITPRVAVSSSLLVAAQRGSPLADPCLLRHCRRSCCLSVRPESGS